MAAAAGSTRSRPGPRTGPRRPARAGSTSPGFITEANGFKAATPALTANGPLRRVTAPNGRVVGLLRLDAGTPLAADSAALAVINPDLARPDGIELGPLLTATGGRIAGFQDATPGVTPQPFVAGRPVTLDPLAVRIFLGSVAEPSLMAEHAEESERRLQELAANRIAVERVSPELDGGRFPVKRVVGDVLTVEADIFVDGHDKLAAVVKYRSQEEPDWHEVPMRFVDNDRWAGSLPAHPQHPLRLHGRGLARPVCLLAGRGHARSTMPTSRSASS